MDIFPNWTVIPIVLFLTILTYILNRTFFRPMGTTLAERSRRIEGARKEAEEIRQASEGRIEEIDRKLREARRESDLHMAQARNQAMDEKNSIISSTRGQADKMVADARAEITNQAANAEKELRAHAQDFAGRIASQILRRPIKSGRKPLKV